MLELNYDTSGSVHQSLVCVEILGQHDSRADFQDDLSRHRAEAVKSTANQIGPAATSSFLNLIASHEDLCRPLQLFQLTLVEALDVDVVREQVSCCCPRARRRCRQRLR